MNYYVKEVKTGKEMNDFVKLPAKIYRDNECYVPDLESDIRDSLDRSKNPNLQTMKLQAFVAYDARGQTVGRILGIINPQANAIWNTRYVRFGMIEFIDAPEVSWLLIEAVERWGAQQGMTRIQGPMGFTDFDKEGMLVEDFDVESSMVTIYNPPYYPQHLERMGFEREADWIQARFDIPAEPPRRITRSVGVVNELYHLHVHQLTNDDIFKKGYGTRVFDLLNKAYRPLFGFSELSPACVQKFLHQYIPLIDLRMVPVIEDEENNIVAVAITLGSLSNALRKSKGRMLPFGWFHLLKSLKFKHEDKVEMLLVAVDPEFQGMGINAIIFDYLIRTYNELGYKWAETGPMLETNLKVLTQWRQLGAQFCKRRRCYGRELKV